MYRNEAGAPTAAQLEKYENLLASLRALGSALVAFSGGVDSAFLMHAAREALGDRAAAATAASPLFPGREQREAEAFCRERGIRQIVFPTRVLETEAFTRNPANRCYLCKRALFGQILEIRKEQGFAAVLEGSNVDDEGDYRPGMRAVKELGILSPLLKAGLTKADIRALSRRLGLPTWDKPSLACLASRFPYGDAITPEKLDRVGRAEQLLLELGFSQVRVRVHGDLARVELLPEQFPLFLRADVREQVVHSFREIGFAYVALDAQGYRTGSMNEVL